MSSNDNNHSVGDMFGGHAELYAQARPTYPAEIYLYIAEISQQTNAVWDCATGTGQAAKELAQYFAQVEATDVNAEQIEKAKEVNDSLENIHFSVQSAEKTNFPDAAFDVITVAQALHWFDYSVYWQEVKRVLKPGGLYAAWGYNWTKTDFYTNSFLEENLFKILQPFWAKEAKTLWDGYPSAAIRFPFARIEMPEFSIKMYWDLVQVLAYFRSWSATQKAIEAWGNDDFFTDATHAIVSEWGNPQEKKLIEFPLHCCFGFNDE